MDPYAAPIDSARECHLTVRLLELTKSTNYELVQENGQRRLTAPEYTKEMRDQAKGSEIFLGRLPRDCYEDELMPMLQTVGRLLELRLMLDFSGSTRGYAFALYENPTIARRACRILDGYAIRPGHKIGVVKSIDNCRLFFGGVPKDKTKEDFMKELSQLLDGIIDIYLYPDTQNKNLNRGFIFVEFKDHRSAAMARRKLIPGRCILWNHEIAVDWADPEPSEPIDDEVMQSVTALFVRNLTIDVPHQKIREIFEKSTGVPVLKLKKINHFAFVHYENRELAQNVLDIMTNPRSVASQQNWEIRWAKPISGAMKIIDREQSIYEATRNTQKDSTAPVMSKRSVTKKRGKKTNQEIKSISAPSQIDFRHILESYVTENLGAICKFDAYATIPYGHICKITIVSVGNEPIFNFQGKNFVSQESAINETSREVYWRLHYVLQNNSPWSLQENEPLGWDTSKWAQQNKIEASR